jgi:GcrA cell cycle regulator
MPVVSFWTDDTVARLKEHWAGGLSASVTADELDREFGGCVTRNAVCGKVDRLGLSAKHPRVVKQRAPRASRTPRQKQRIAPSVFAAEPLPPERPFEMPVEQRCTLIELNAARCHWPVGDPAHADFFFCGGKPWAGSPYCAYHTRVAYQPAAARRGPRRPAFVTTAQGRWA